MARQRAAPVARPKQAAAAKARPSHRPPAPAHQHRSSAGPLIKLQETAGNKAVTRLMRREAVAPEARDALMQAAKAQIDSGLKMIPECLGLAGQVQGDLQGEAAMPANAESAQGPSNAGLLLQSRLALAGSTLDGGIKLYQDAGGELCDLEHVVNARAQLSTACFFLTQALAGATPLAAKVVQHLLSAVREGQLAGVDEAIRAAAAANTNPGAADQDEANAKLAKSLTLQVHLQPFGKAPTIAP